MMIFEIEKSHCLENGNYGLSDEFLPEKLTSKIWLVGFLLDIWKISSWGLGQTSKQAAKL